MADEQRMTISLGADHGGYELKLQLKKLLERDGHRVQDVGTHSPEPCDYPKVALKVARAVSAGKVERGILMCKSGVGMAIAANKVPGVRAAVVSSVAVAKKSREHNDTNVMVLGAVGLSPSMAIRMIRAWLATPFEGGRHARRIRQIEQIEQQYCQKRS